MRFAPSPTGSLHVGGARTALFNWLIARHTGGTFVLRMEDTDRERSTPESEAEILRCLTWLGLDWDEGPFRQSERGDVYAAAIARLKAAGAIYPAYESDEELEAQRAAARADRRAPVVRGRRDRDPAEIAALEAAGVRPAWRFAVEVEGQTVIEDYVRGPVTFEHGAIEDFIVVRSDGTPTYNLAAAVDDLDMGITHVLRGEDHISNTPKQMMVIRALGGDTPDYAHIPLILGEDKKRLSKRHGAASVEDLEAAGYLPRATVNALALLGWSFDDKTTIFTVPELIEGFSVGRISKSPAIFDLKKLQVLNGRHLRLMPVDEFTEALVGWLRDDRLPGRARPRRRGAGARERAARQAQDQHLRRLRRPGGLAVRAARDPARGVGGADARRQALHPGHRERPGAPGGAARVHGRVGQGRPPGPAPRDGRGGARLPGAPADRGHRPPRVHGHLREPGAARPRRGLRALPPDPGPARRAVGARVMFAPGTQRRLMLTAAWLFGIFLVVAFVFRRLDISEETDAIVAGVTAYVFLLAAAVILYRGWRQRDRDAAMAATMFVERHPSVPQAVGRPVDGGPPRG